MLILGLTGGIATGKSTVAEILEQLGAYRIDADRLAREVVQPGKPAWRSIVSHFGPGVLYFDRQLNRHALASIIFDDPRARHALEEFTHPPIKELIREQIIKARKSGTKVALLEVPLLFETGLDNEADKIVVVVAEELTQVDRMLKRDDLSDTEARKRITAQMSLAEKAKQADYIIYNTGTRSELEEQVKRLWLELTEAVTIPESIEGDTVLWSSDNEAVAVVSENGVVTPVGPGSATIVAATTDGTQSDTCDVTVAEPPKLSSYELICDTSGLEPVLDSAEATPLTLSIRTRQIHDLGCERAKLKVAVTDKPFGSKMQLLAPAPDGGTYDVAAARSYGPDEGFAMTKDYSADIEFNCSFNKAGTYTISFILINQDNTDVMALQTATINVQPQKQASSYAISVDTTGLQFVAGAGESTVLPVTVRAAEVRELGYERIRFNVSVTEKPAGAGVRLQSEDSAGRIQDAAVLGYLELANGFPLSRDYSKTIYFECAFEVEGSYTIKFSLTDLNDNEKGIASHSVTIPVQGLPELSEYEIDCDTDSLEFMAASTGAGAPLPVTIKAKKIKGMGYENVKLEVSVADMPHGAKAELLAADEHGTLFDTVARGSFGPPKGFELDRDHNMPINFHAKFDKEGYYTIRFILKDLAENSEIASCITVIKVLPVPVASTYEFFCSTKGLKFVAQSDEATLLPVTVRTKEVKDFGYDNVRFNVSVTSRPVGGKAQLFAKSGRGRVYDAAVLGYWGAATGFPVDRDYNTTMEFDAKFDKVGDYVITFSLVDLNDESKVIASKDVKITVSEPLQYSVFELVTETKRLEFVAKSEAGTVIPVTIRTKEVKDLGYENAILYTAVTRRPLKSHAKLVAADSEGRLFDSLVKGFWGPEGGFPLPRDCNKTVEFNAKFDTPGNYTVIFTLSDLNAVSSVIARVRIQARVSLEAADEGATKLALNRHSLKLTAGGLPAVLVATPVKESETESAEKH